MHICKKSICNKLFSFGNKCDNRNNEIFKEEEELVEILKSLGLTDNINE